MADCEKYIDLISLYADGELGDTEKAELFAHLETCGECASLFKVVTGTSGLFSEEPEPPEELVKNVMAGVAAIKKKKTRVIYTRWLTAAACLALAVFASVRFLPGLRMGKSADNASPATFETRKEAIFDGSDNVESPSETNGADMKPEESKSGALRFDGGFKDEAPEAFDDSVPDAAASDAPYDEEVAIPGESAYTPLPEDVLDEALHEYRTVLVARGRLPEEASDLSIEERDGVCFIYIENELAEKLSEKLEAYEGVDEAEGSVIIYLP